MVVFVRLEAEIDVIVEKEKAAITIIVIIENNSGSGGSSSYSSSSSRAGIPKISTTTKKTTAHSIAPYLNHYSPHFSSNYTEAPLLVFNKFPRTTHKICSPCTLAVLIKPEEVIRNFFSKRCENFLLIY